MLRKSRFNSEDLAVIGKVLATLGVGDYPAPPGPGPRHVGLWSPSIVPMGGYHP